MFISTLCSEVRNYFINDLKDIHSGIYKVEGGVLSPCDFLADGQYYRIAGTTFSDGVYRYPEAPQIDGEFKANVWAMRVPQDFIDLAAEIEAYNEGEGKPSAFTSESFGGYSYSKGTVNGKPMGWRDVFSDRLAQYRRARII